MYSKTSHNDHLGIKTTPQRRPIFQSPEYFPIYSIIFFLGITGTSELRITTTLVGPN